MKRFKVLFLAVVAVSALASVLATSAFASGPTLLFLGSEGPTVLINNKPNEEVPSELQSEVARISGKKLSTEITLLEEKGVAAGIYHADFFETKLGSEVCHSEGDASGTILVPQNPVELVYTSTSPLEVGSLFTVASFKVICVLGTEETKITIKGNVLGSLSPINTEIEKGANTIKGGLICSAVGVPSKTKYTNSKGEAKEAKLEATVAGKTAGACELVGTALTSTIPLLPNKMVEVMG